MITERHTLESHRYPLDMASLVSKDYQNLHLAQDFLHTDYDATIIAQAALFHWNSYLSTEDENALHAFLAHARWLVEHEVRLDTDMGGWPSVAAHPDSYNHSHRLSSLTQGCALSVLIRAYILTHEGMFLAVARHAVQTFMRDILDGGVNTPVGKHGVFFEEIAIYPASHGLQGFLFGVIGLYDCANITQDADMESLIQRSLATFHDFLDEFDTGFWTRSELLRRQHSTRSELSIQVALLDALSALSQCTHCASLAGKWRDYQQRLDTQLRYAFANCRRQVGHILLQGMRNILFPQQRETVTDTAIARSSLRVCVPITAFPVTGGMRSVLFRIIQVTKPFWQMEYVTHFIGPNADEFLIHRFGTTSMSPWQFPGVWLYTCAGFFKLTSLLRNGASYDVVLLQDGIYTAAFGGLVAKLAGIRSVCIDHGNLSILESQHYRVERMKTLASTHWSLPRRLLARIRYQCYWPSLSLLARLGTHVVDHYYIPGAIGDGVEDICHRLGVPSSRITRFANMIETEKHSIPDATQRVAMRAQYGIAEEAMVIAIICRLAPEKGLEITLEAIGNALSSLPADTGKRLHILIAGDGPLRSQLEEDIRLRGLSEQCLMWGEASQEEVIGILGMSDIFLFTSWRAAGYPLTVLEAMASACAVIAATDSLATQEMLADGRGVILSVGDIAGTAQAIVQLVSNPQLCHDMGRSARSYVASQHSPDMFRRSLMRVVPS
ncbi:MAG TPA: hypothetical protein DHW02_02865 [Ktedonobacter sp.]|nr:hypothetical protein [Ktedonobacter sp.]